MRLDLCQVWSFHAITITVSPRAHAWALFLTALMSLARLGGRSTGHDAAKCDACVKSTCPAPAPAQSPKTKHLLEDIGVPALVGVVGAIIVTLFCILRSCRNAHAAREAEKRENLLL